MSDTAPALPPLLAENPRLDHGGGFRATGRAPVKQAAEHTVVGRNAPRVDLAAKVFGQAAFVHDMAMAGMVHARVVRQPRRTATLASLDEAAIRRAAKGPVEILRTGNF